jgi:hypothetical protein
MSSLRFLPRAFCVAVLLLALAAFPALLSAQSQTAPADVTASATTDTTTTDAAPADAVIAPAATPPADATTAASAPADAGTTPAETAPTDSTAAATGETGTGNAPSAKKPSAYARKVRFHEISGFTSGSLLLASGIVGAVHVIDMMSVAHAYRDRHTIEEVAPECSVVIRDSWSGDQALRWVHVGLLSAGELLYLADAISGLTMLTPELPGLTKQDIHRYAFFTHAALMAAEIVLGFFTTDALQRGDHNTMLALGIAHTAIGLAIPTVILGAGIYAASR